MRDTLNHFLVRRLVVVVVVWWARIFRYNIRYTIGMRHLEHAVRHTDVGRGKVSELLLLVFGSTFTTYLVLHFCPES